MANRYWVGGSGTWSSTSTTNWSATSGGAGGASVPTSVDDVFFDANSNIGTSAFTVSCSTTAPLNCNNFTIAGLDGPMGIDRLGFSGSVTINCFGSWDSGGIYFGGLIDGSLNFQATTTGKTINTGGGNFGGYNVAFLGVGGEWTLLSNFVATTPSNLSGGVWTQTRGTVNTNGFNVTISRHMCGFSPTATLNLGSSIFTVIGVAFGDTSSGFVINAGTSTIRFTQESSTTSGVNLLTPNNAVLYDVEFINTANNAGAIVLQSTAFSVRNLTVNGSSASVAVRRVSLGGNVTVTGTLNLNTSSPGAATRLSFVGSSVLPRQRTVTVATAGTIRDVDFAEITFTGAAAPLNGTSTRLGDAGSNTGITFSPTKAVYWNLPAGGSWDSTAWALSSGGAVNVNNFPLVQDNVIFDDVGLNSGATVNFNASYFTGTITTSARTLPMTLAGGSATVSLYRNITLNGVVTFTSSASPVILFAGIGTAQLVEFAAVPLTGSVTVNNIGGSVTLLNNFFCGAFNVSSGSLNLNNQTLTATSVSLGGATTVAFGSGGAFNITGSGSCYSQASATPTFTGSRTVNFTNSGGSGLTVAGGTNTNALIVANFPAGSYNVVLSGYFLGINTTGKTAGAFSSGSAIRLYGNLTLSAGLTYTAQTAFYANATLTTNGVLIGNSMTISGGSAVLTLGDAVSFTGTFNGFTFITSGTLNLNNFNLTCSSFGHGSGGDIVVNFGTGVINIYGTSGTILGGISSPTSVTVTGANPTINLTATAGLTTRNIAWRDTTGSVNLNVTGGLDNVTSNSQNYFKNVNFTGFTGTFSPSIYSFIITGDLTCSTGMIFASASGSFNFTGGGTKSIDFGGRTFTFGAFFNCTGTAAYNLTSGGFSTGAMSINTPSSPEVYSLAFNSNNHNFTCTSISLPSTNSFGSTTLNLGSSTITITGVNGFQATYNSPTSYGPLTWVGSPSIIYSATANNAPLRLLPLTVFAGASFNSVSWAANTDITGEIAIRGATSFTSLALPTKTSSGSGAISFANNVTISGNLSFNGSATKTNRVVVTPAVVGNGGITISAGSISGLQNIDFIRVDANGAAIPWSGTDLGDGGGNTDITFNAGANKYWNLPAGGNWNSTAWASSSGGSPTAADFPLLQDNAIIEDTGLNSGSTITFNSIYYLPSINSSTRTLPFIFALSSNIFCTRDINFSTATSTTGNTFNFSGGALQNITLANALSRNVVINSPEVRLQPAGLFAGSFAGRVTLTSGGFNLNGSVVDINSFSATSSENTLNVNFSSSARINLTGLTESFSTTLDLLSSTLTYTGTNDYRFTGAATTSTRTVRGPIAGTGTPPNVRVTNGTSGNQIVAQLSLNNLDFTGTLSSVLFTAARIYGNVTLGAGQTVGVPGSVANRPVHFLGTGTQTLASNSCLWTVPISVRTGTGGSGTLSLADTFTSSSDIYVENGTFTTNNQTVTASNFRVAAELVDTNPKVINLGSSVVTVSGAGVNAWNTNNANATVNAGTSIVAFTGAANRTFNGGNKTFATVSNDNTAGALTIDGNPIIGTLSNTVSPGQFNFAAGTTTTVTNFNINGAIGALVNIRSTVSGTRAILSKSTGTVNTNYLNIQDSEATGGATWNAYFSNGNIDSGNNLGWDFQAAFVSGVAAVGQVGTVIVDVPNVVNAVGIAATGEVGIATVLVPGVVVSVSGVAATGFVGALIIPNNTISVTGVSATGFVNAVSIASIVVNVNGVAATGFVGTAVVSSPIIVNVNGIAASGQVGVVTVLTPSVTVNVSGVFATGFVGTIAKDIAVNVNGAFATGFVGTPTFLINSVVNLGGTECQGQVGTLFFFQWSTIDDAQDPGWVPVNDSNTPIWATINPNNTPVWTDVIT